MTDDLNVLLIMCDQMRWDAISGHGNAVVQTPHLDRLLDSGTTFRRCFTEAPVCVPARSTMLTGRRAHLNGVFDNDDILDHQAHTFATAATGVGYRTQAIGKMHFTPTRSAYGIQDLALSEEIPESVASDEFLRDMVAAGFGHVEEPHGVRHELYYVPQVSQLPQDLHTTAWTGRRTVDFLDAAAGDSRPWLCWTSFVKPHPPFDPPAPWHRLYDPTKMPDPLRHPTEREHLEYRIRSQHRFKWTSPDLPLPLLRTMKSYYYASVSFVDHWIGQILDALERTGQRERTLVLFTADHGEHLGDHWAFGKRTFHDSAARIPMILSCPGRLPSREQVDDYIGLIDVAPTILDVIGADPNVLQPEGQSLLPRLIDGAWRQPRNLWIGVLGRDRVATYAVFDERVKYIYSAADAMEYALPVGEGVDESQWLPPSDPRYEHAMALGADLRDRLAHEGLAHVVDGETWRRFTSLPDVREFDDRAREDRGLQFARWLA